MPRNMQPGLFSSSDVTKTSDELRSESMRRRWLTDEHKAKLKEASARPETKALRSEAAKAYWAKLSPEQRRERLKSAHSAVKGGHKVTSLEAKVIAFLNAQDAWYRVHCYVGGYVADLLVMPDLIVECDGVAWHANDSQRDQDRDGVLRASGYKILRLTEEEIMSGNWDKLSETLCKEA